MHLSLHADYALRTLIYLGSHPDRPATTAEISRAYGISKHHLARVVRTLAERGYVVLTPGRAGGVSLRGNASKIRLGQVVRDTEPHLRMVECFDPKTNTCPIVSSCGLKAVLSNGIQALLAELDKHTLADLLTPKRRSQLVQIFARG